VGDEGKVGASAGGGSRRIVVWGEGASGGGGVKHFTHQGNRVP